MGFTTFIGLFWSGTLANGMMIGSDSENCTYTWPPPSFQSNPDYFQCSGVLAIA